MKDMMKNEEKSRFIWIPFYTELAEKLLEYKNNRASLIDFIFSKDGLQDYSKYLHLQDKTKKIDDIDPFSFFGIFNHGIMKNENRITILQKIKNKFQIRAVVPSVFYGVPVLNYARSFYYHWSSLKDSCNVLWDAFEAMMKGNLNPWFDYCPIAKRKAECTMPLFWCKANDYIALDSNNVIYLKSKGVDINVTDVDTYLVLLQTIKNRMVSGKIIEKTFAEISYNAWKNTSDNSDNSIIEQNMMPGIVKQYTHILQLKKNIILQGAPGTGKTYNTATLALSICGETIPEKHEDVMKRYGELQKEGRIGFCTFHQSMDYEDFVEGIKPKTVNEQISYEIEPGIFKTMCENAKSIITEKKSEKIDFSKTRVFKMSLGEKGKNDAEIFDYCLENNVVGLGWGGDKDFSQCKTREDFKALDDTWGAFAMEVFKQWMQIGDIILISDGTKSVKAIARIAGDYEFRKDAPIDMCQFRKVEWLYTGDIIPISKLYDKNLSQQSIYAFYFTPRYGKPDYNGTIKVDVINDIITGKVDDETPQNYVLIIDEINRGNVSKIFGELITLLEADKRIGGEHPIKVTLPYSKESFGVPSNLYIIGTMNTTDRSVGNIDYAVRRRFAFVTLKADRQILVSKYGEESKQVQLFDAIFTFLNDDKKHPDMDIDDLMVGHSYFMADDDDELKLKLEYEIIPLIREYSKDGIVNVKNEELEKVLYDWKTAI